MSYFDYIGYFKQRRLEQEKAEILCEEIERLNNILNSKIKQMNLLIEDKKNTIDIEDEIYCIKHEIKNKIKEIREYGFEYDNILYI